MKPGDYPLRSSQSRAAARHVLALRRAAEGEGMLVRLRFVGDPPRWDQKCTCTCPAPTADTSRNLQVLFSSRSIYAERWKCGL